MFVVPMTSPSPSQTGDVGEEIARLKEQIKNLQKRRRGEENGKGKEPRHMKRAEREEGQEAEGESKYGMVEAFLPYNPKNPRR